MTKDYSPLMCSYGCPFMEHDIKNDVYWCKVSGTTLHEDPFAPVECQVDRNAFERYALKQMAFITTAIGRRMDLEELQKARKQNEEQKPDVAA